MAVTWGSWAQDIRVGIDVVITSESSTSVSYTVHWYVGVMYNISDSQTLTIGGDTSAKVIDYHVSTGTSGGSKLIFSRSFTASKVYGGGPTFTFTGRITGHYGGATPTHSRSFTIPARTPTATSAPGTPTISNLASRTARANWSAPSNNNGAAPTSYNMHLATNSSFTAGLSSVSTSNRYYDITGMTPGRQYYVRVRASNGYGWSPWSGTRGFVAKPETPGAPSLSAASSVTPTSFRTTLTPSSDTGGETPSEYQLQYSLSSSFTAPVTIVFGTGTRTVSGLDPDTTYYFRARAANSAGWSSWSSSRSVTTQTGLPSTAGRPTVTNVQPDRATVNWTAPSTYNGGSFSKYQVQWATDSAFTENVESRDTTSTGVILTGLTPGIRYYVRVRAYSNYGAGPWSSSRLFETISGALVYLGGEWVNAKVYIRMDGQWVLGRVYKRVNNAWVN